MHQNHNFITINIVAALHFWTILVPIFYGVIDITKNASSFLEKFVIFMAVTDSHFLWHIFSSTVKWLFIMNFVSNCQFFSLERCNKAHWNPVSPCDGVMKVADTGFHPRRCHSLLLPTNINGLKSKILQY